MRLSADSIIAVFLRFVNNLHISRHILNLRLDFFPARWYNLAYAICFRKGVFYAKQRTHRS